ncbi:uncharacterized protein LOC115212303 [Argonauta hians]
MSPYFLILNVLLLTASSGFGESLRRKRFECCGQSESRNHMPQISDDYISPNYLHSRLLALVKRSNTENKWNNVPDFGYNSRYRLADKLALQTLLKKLLEGAGKRRRDVSRLSQEVYHII